MTTNPSQSTLIQNTNVFDGKHEPLATGMSIGKKAVIQAAHVMASTGLDLITEPEFFQAAKAEFVKRTGGKKYVSLNVEPASPGGCLDEAQKKSFNCVIHAVIEDFGIKEAVS